MNILAGIRAWLVQRSINDAIAAMQQFNHEEQITILMEAVPLGVISIAHDRKVEKLRAAR